MTDFLLQLGFRSCFMSLLVLLWRGIARLAGRSYAAKWRFASWYVLLLGYLLPLRPRLVAPVVVPSEVLPYAAAGAAHTSLLPAVLFGLWLAGVMLMLSVELTRHRAFLHFTARDSSDLSGQREERILRKVAAELRARPPRTLCRTPLVSSPMVVSLFHPVLLLPVTDFSDAELYWIFRHELTHLRRRDMLYKLLSCLCRAVHWFNPAVYLITRLADKDCEESCDEAAMRGTPQASRVAYCRALLHVAATGAIPRSAFSTQLFADKASLKRRMSALLEGGGRLRLRAVTAVLAVLILLGASLVGAAPASGEDNVANTSTYGTTYPAEDNSLTAPAVVRNSFSYEGADGNFESSRP